MLETGGVVAVKRLKKDTYRTGVNLGAVKELQALSELAHANVLAVRARACHAAWGRRCRVTGRRGR